jgi:hypothetical protein
MPAWRKPQTISWQEALNRLVNGNDRSEAIERLYQAVVNRLIQCRPLVSLQFEGRLDRETGVLRMHARDNHPRQLRPVLSDFERYFQLKAAKDNAAVGSYMPAYLALIHQAIEEFQITDDNQPKLNDLSTWFQDHDVNGKKVSERLANAMATIVRRPESMRGGARRQRRKG